MASATNANAPKRVAIIGAGVTGLLIAQGLLKVRLYSSSALFPSCAREARGKADG